MLATRGANILDKKCPGWASGIDLDTLSMNHFDLCVLGQCCGGYKKGIRRLGLWTIVGSIGHGFFLPWFGAWSKLKAAWFPLIKQRQQATA